MSKVSSLDGTSIGPPSHRTGPYLSIADIQARWSVGRTYVYGAIAEMEAQGYLRRLQLGRLQRIAMESIEKYEALHTTVEAPPARALVPATPRRVARPPRTEPTGQRESIREFARRLG